MLLGKLTKTAAVMLAVCGISMGTVATAGAAETAVVPEAVAGSLPGTGSLPGMSFGSSGSLGHSDTGSLGIGENAPTMRIEQDGSKVRARFEGAGLLGLCSAVVTNPAGLLQLGSDPVDAVLSGKVGRPMSALGMDFTLTLDPGVYVVLGACATKSDVAVQAIVTPAGPVGSLEGGLGFGRDMGEAIIGSLDGLS